MAVPPFLPALNPQLLHLQPVRSLMVIFDTGAVAALGTATGRIRQQIDDEHAEGEEEVPPEVLKGELCQVRVLPND